MVLTSTKERIAANLALVRERIASVAQGRQVELICVTKYAKDEWVEALIGAGAKHLAENRLPRGQERFNALRARGLKFTAHMIGAQQSRKLKLIPGAFDWLHAIDRWKTASLLNAALSEQGLTIHGLLQVNIGSEEQKHGTSAAEAQELFSRIRTLCPSIQLRGVMAVPPGPQAYADMQAFEAGTRGYFVDMYRLFDKIRASETDAPEVDTLSLGMSLDYVWAIEEGATMVRVGSALYEGLEG